VKQFALSIRKISVRMYWIAAISNALALGMLLLGTITAMHRIEQFLAVGLTSVSMICWIIYFRTQEK